MFWLRSMAARSPELEADCVLRMASLASATASTESEPGLPLVEEYGGEADFGVDPSLS